MSVVAISQLVERGIYDVPLHPTVELTQAQRNRVQLIAQGRADLGYNNPSSEDYNTVFASAQTLSSSHEQHQKGLLGEAAVSIHHSDDRSLHALDDDLTRHGDDGVDLEISGWLVDVKTTEWGYDRGKTPLLKVKREKYLENLERIEETGEKMAYYLVEKVSEMEVRIIGYILADVFDEVAEAIDEDETYRPDDEDFRFRSHADNLVAEPKHLWLSYRDD